jgi:hypothetical protein
MQQIEDATRKRSTTALSSCYAKRSALEPKQAYAISQSIWRHLHKVNGHPPFGYDWRTLRITNPQIAKTMHDCYVVLGQA